VDNSYTICAKTSKKDKDIIGIENFGEVNVVSGMFVKCHKEKVYSALIKRACGYEAEDTVEEVTYDNAGNGRISKIRTTKYHVAPDMSAIKILLDANKGDDERDLTEQELVKERDRLIALLVASRCKGKRVKQNNK